MTRLSDKTMLPAPGLALPGRAAAMPVPERAGELAQAADAFGEHDHLLLTRDSGDRLRGDPAQQRQPVAAALHRLAHEALASQCLRECGLGVQQRLGIDARVEEHADVAEHDPLGA